jgi:arylsulfatase
MNAKSVSYIVSVMLIGTLVVFISLSGFITDDVYSGTQADRRPNIILITVDTLKADHLSCYGYSKNTSPFIDQFAQDALLFENCLSHAPETWSSCASILSGFLPHETQVIENLSLPAKVETLPEILKRLEYKTVAVVSNYMLCRKRGWDQGFMIYDDTMNDRELVRRWPERIAEHTTDRAIELLKQFHQDQLFIWIHYQDPHGPYTPPDRFAKLFQNSDQRPRHLKVNSSLDGHGGIPSYQKLGVNRDFYHYLSQYDGEIRYLDEHFKRLIDALKKFGLYEDALIIFSSDHGEGMGEHNYYFAHGENLYSTLIHVPLIIKYGKELKGRRTDFVQHIDIVPTILNVLGLKTDSRLRGRDLRKQHGTKREIFSEMKSLLFKNKYKFSLVLDDLKLICNPQLGQYELFDLKTDHKEVNNLIKDPKYREPAEDLKLRLNRICKEDFLQLHRVEKPLKLTDEESEKLKSLGYAQ